MPKVGIVMGSDSDMPVMSKAADILEKLGIDYEMKIISAHREPDVFFEYDRAGDFPPLYGRWQVRTPDHGRYVCHPEVSGNRQCHADGR